MYFPANFARKLIADAAIPQQSPVRVLCVSASSQRTLFCTITASGLSVWRVRPSVVLAHLTRTPLSLQDHGENKAAQWSPDGSSIVIQTDSHLIFVGVNYALQPQPFKPTPRPRSREQDPGPGEGTPLQRIHLVFEGVVQIQGRMLCISPRHSCIMFSTANPSTVQRISWPNLALKHSREQILTASGQPITAHDTWEVNATAFPWLLDHEVSITSIQHSAFDSSEVWVTSDGAAYFVRLDDGRTPPDTPGALRIVDREAWMPSWQGLCINSPSVPLAPALSDPRTVTMSAINGLFSLIALAIDGGDVVIINHPTPSRSHNQPQVFKPPDIYSRIQSGEVLAMEWSTDGCVLAVGYEHGWAIWSLGGRCLVWGFLEEPDLDRGLEDTFMSGVLDLCWGPESTELIVLAANNPSPDDQLYIMPFAKSATAEQQAPDNTRYAVLQLDDRILVYRGADQPDMSVINPESDVWEHIKIPPSYIAHNWPVRYAAISTDGRLVAVAGRRGLVHYSSTSGRWKVYTDKIQEQAFVVRGGMVWFHHVLIAAVEVGGSFQIRLHSRDLDLTTQNIISREMLNSPVVLLSLADNSLLVYTADNVLYHYLVIPTEKTIKLHLCGSINFDGVIQSPTAVRCLSWMIPSAQKQFGDPTEDLSVATILMLIGGRLILLRPRKTGTQEVKYDMQIMAERIEFCWIHLRGIGTLENSLWGYDGRNIRVWLDALTIEATPVDPLSGGYEFVKESVNFRLDFYPLSVLMDKGIVLGTESEVAIRSSMPFVQFRFVTSTHLFLQHMLRVYLEKQQVDQAVQLASHYKNLVFFAHVLEVLIHTVLEMDEAEEETEAVRDQILDSTVEFLDYFDQALEVIVGCARKTEMARWERLFNAVGSPKMLFEACLASNRFRIATSYLLVLHGMDERHDVSSDAVRLLKKGIDAEDWELCKDVLRFAQSVDDTGMALRYVMKETGLVEAQNGDAS